MKNSNFLFLELPLISNKNNLNSENSKPKKIKFQVSRINTLSSQKEDSYFDSDSGLYFTLIGYISNFDELNKTYLSNYDSDLQLIPFLWKLLKGDVFTVLKGVFTLVIYNTYTGGLCIFLDEYGYNQPLYYAKLNNVFYFSSSLKQLLSKSDCVREMDKESVRQFLLTGFLYFGNVVPSEKTLFKSINKLLPSQIIFRNSFDETPKIILKKTYNKKVSSWY
ncbi:MAG: hypothetical protein IMY72_06570 [Bacteroidetes bacterium]|nr:hypothetical protein [Bacteroidota bacterium]